jgi:hypothetical protein
VKSLGAFEKGSSKFWGNKKSENYVEIVEELLSSHRALGCNMLLKLHLLHSNLEFFSENMRAFSDEHFEKFRQDIFRMEERYSGKGTQICWLITAGSWYGRHQQKNTRDKRQQNVLLVLH